MKKGYLLKTLAIFASALLIVYAGFETVSFFTNYADDNLSPINVSYAEIQPSPDQENLVQIEIAVNDNPFSEKEKIREVTFNRRAIFLRKADAKGKRAQAFLQVKPGYYTICWKIKNGRYSFSKYSKTIPVNEKDMWIHVLIKGAQITVTN